MSETLTVRWTEAGLEWVVTDRVTGSVTRTGSGDVAAFREAGIVVDGETRVLLPGERILLTRARIPSRQPRQIQQAVPFAVEEKLAVDVERCHFATGQRNPDDELEVVVIDRAYLKDCLAELEDAGIEADRISADLLVLGANESGIRILVDGDRVHLMAANGHGVTCEAENLALACSTMVSGDEEPIEILVRPEDRDRVEIGLSEISTLEGVEVSVIELDVSPLEYLAKVDTGRAVDFLQGEFRVERKQEGGYRGWRIAAVLAVSAFFLKLALLLGEGLYMDYKAGQYAMQARALYQEVFPGDRNVRDLRRRWRAHLGTAGRGSSEDFLSLFARAAGNIPGSGLRLQNVNYNESRGDLVMQFQAPRSEDLVVFSEKLISAGLPAEIGTISQEEESVRGSIRIKYAGGRR